MIGCLPWLIISTKWWWCAFHYINFPCIEWHKTDKTISQTNCLYSGMNVHPVSMLLIINNMYGWENLHHMQWVLLSLPCRHDSASVSIWNNGKRTGNYCWYHVCAFFTLLSQPFPLLSLQQNSITLILPYNHFSSLRLDSFPGLTEKA